MKSLKNAIQKFLNSFGYEVRTIGQLKRSLLVEFSQEERDLFEHVHGNNLSMVSEAGMFTTMMACKHVINRKIEGDFVECGVWRGGNALLAAGIFKIYGVDKKVYLYDTFEGMTEPTEFDTKRSDGTSAKSKFLDSQKDGFNEWCYSSIDEVKDNFRKAHLLNENVVFVKGDVLETLGNSRYLPKVIAVLRLDTDWYESTKIELETLYPLVSIGGALIIDDYGWWSGAKKAVDEYFEKHVNLPFLQYTDYTGRVGIKFD